MPKKQAHRRDGIYTRPDAPGYWGSWTAADGRRIRRHFKVPALLQAKLALQAERLRVEETIKFGKTLPTEETFNTFADVFLDYQERRVSAKVVKGKLFQAEFERQKGVVEKHLKPFFGSMRLAAIRRKDVAAYIDSRIGKVTDGTVIKEMNSLKRLFNVAVEKEKIEVNPAHRAPVPKAPEGRNRYLTADELGILVSLHVVLPVLSLVNVRCAELPVLFRLIDALKESLSLLIVRKVQEYLDDLRGVAMKVLLQIDDRAKPCFQTFLSSRNSWASPWLRRSSGCTRTTSTSS